jgi:hypothetical protein
MKKFSVLPVALTMASFILLFCFSIASQAGDKDMSFFVSSVGSGNGGDLGGLAGADEHCQTLATAVAAKKNIWHAYLSSASENARDRIGKGPWYNAMGVIIAKDLKDLHSNNNNISKEHALTEKGALINGHGDKPNLHDILTGSLTDHDKSQVYCKYNVVISNNQ